jgi:hypothetical protein
VLRLCDLVSTQNSVKGFTAGSFGWWLMLLAGLF